jgi:hemerythrin-like metal-binding protein
MPKIVWSKRYSVNVKKLDDQHRRIAELVNAINARIKAREDSEGIVEGFTDLIAFTQGHFESEEVLMKRLDYPELKRHKKEHKELVNLLCDVRKQFKRETKSLGDFDYDVARDWLAIHSDWFSVHLVHSDKDFGEFLNKKGID